MGRAIDLFVTYRFIRLLTTPFEKTDAFKMGIIDKDGNRTDKKLYKIDEKTLIQSCTNLFSILRNYFKKCLYLELRLELMQTALFLLKDTFKEHVEDPQMFEKEFLKYLKENNIELDDSIVEEVTLDNGKLSKGIYILVQDVVSTGEEEDEIDALEGDEVEVFEDTPPTDTILGVDVFPVIHRKNKTEDFCIF